MEQLLSLARVCMVSPQALVSYRVMFPVSPPFLLWPTLAAKFTSSLFGPCLSCHFARFLRLSLGPEGVAAHQHTSQNGFRRQPFRVALLAVQSVIWLSFLCARGVSRFDFLPCAPFQCHLTSDTSVMEFVVGCPRQHVWCVLAKRLVCRLQLSSGRSRTHSGTTAGAQILLSLRTCVGTRLDQNISRQQRSFPTSLGNVVCNVSACIDDSRLLSVPLNLRPDRHSRLSLSGAAHRSLHAVCAIYEVPRLSDWGTWAIPCLWGIASREQHRCSAGGGMAKAFTSQAQREGGGAAVADISTWCLPSVQKLKGSGLSPGVGGGGGGGGWACR